MKNNIKFDQNNIEAAFSVLECPEIICAGRPFSLLLEVNEPICLKINSSIVSACEEKDLCFDKSGIFELRLICDRIVNDFTFTIESEDHNVACSILRSLEKPIDDHIVIKKSNLTCAESCSVSEPHIKSRILAYLKYMHAFTEIGSEKEDMSCDFYRYVLSHTRTGEFYSSFALICDMNVIQIGEDWDILNLLYPESEFDNPVPKGAPALVSLKDCAFENYKAISFTGYNKAEESDLDNLLAFVHTGGTLIAGWPHLSVTTNRKDIENGSFSIIKHKLGDYLCSDAGEFISDTYCGKSIDICPNVKCDDVIATTDSGYPLAFIKRIGLGQVFFINAMQYPANAGVKPLYEAILSEVSDNLNAEEKIFLSCGKDVGFTVYDQKDGARHIYVLAVDWYRNPEIMRKAVLKLGAQKYNIDVPFGSMLKIVAKDNIALWSEDENVEVLLITANVATLQGYGKTKIKIAQGGSIVDRKVDFTHKPIQAIQI